MMKSYKYKLKFIDTVLLDYYHILHLYHYTTKNPH